MTLTVRVIVTTLTVLAVGLWAGPVAGAQTSLIAEPTGSDTARSMLYAGVAGLAVGGVIAFWQSRKRRRDNGGKPGDERDST